jgi:hypothetical protein
VGAQSVSLHRQCSNSNDHIKWHYNILSGMHEDHLYCHSVTRWCLKISWHTYHILIHNSIMIKQSLVTVILSLWETTDNYIDDVFDGISFGLIQYHCSTNSVTHMWYNNLVTTFTHCPLVRKTILSISHVLVIEAWLGISSLVFIYYSTNLIRFSSNITISGANTIISYNISFVMKKYMNK